jgi:peptidoglycan/xylan/chitin deacetylase (PgdA/CDA1 family)
MPDVLVLCYHAVSPTWPAVLSTTPERFRAQLEHLAARGYEGVTFSEAAVSNGRGKRVAVTFDDAYRSVGALGRPILDSLGWPATVFVPTDHAGTGAPMVWPGIDEWLGGPHESELVAHDWDELRELAAAGWEIGSHTCSHPHLTSLDDDPLARELSRSRDVCETELGAPCPAIAYPYGDVDARVVRATAAAGYALGAALPPKPHAVRPFEYPRVGVYQVDDLRRFRLKTSPLVRRLRTALGR